MVDMFLRIWLWLRALLIVTGAVLLLVTFTPVVPWAAGGLSKTWTDTDHGVLILLSGDEVTYEGTAPRHAIGLRSYWRAIHAIYLWRRGHFENLLLSGEHSGETIKPLLVANGIPETAIVVEDRSRTTRENALFSQPLLANLSAPYVLLTSDYHTYRAARVFAKAGIRIETIPAPDLLKRANNLAGRWQCLWDLLAEYAAIADYRIRGWI